MKMICPNCSAQLESPEDLSGRQVQCPSCNKTFVVEKNVSFHETSEGASRRGQTDHSVQSSGKKKFIYIGAAATGVAIGVCIGGFFYFRNIGAEISVTARPSKQIETVTEKTVLPSRQEPKAQPDIKTEMGQQEKESLEKSVTEHQSNIMFQKAMMYKKHGLNADAKKMLIDLINSSAKKSLKATALHLLGMIEFEENHISVALSTWQMLVKEYPESSEAMIIRDKIKELSQIVGEIGKEYIDNAVAESYLQHGRFWSRGRDVVFHIDTSWISNVDAAIKWYDRVISEFPGTEAARIAYEEKMRTIQGWKDPGQYGESFGMKQDPNKYLALLISTFNEYAKAFPTATAINAFRFQIGQIYWERKDKINTEKWLMPIIETSGDSFYKDLAQRRLAAPVPVNN